MKKHVPCPLCAAALAVLALLHAGGCAPQAEEPAAPTPESTLTSWSDREMSGRFLGHGRSEVLLAYGFQDGETFYTGSDENGALTLEVYFDPETGRGCGFCYGQEALHGFGFEAEPGSAQGDPWADTDPYSVTAWDGTDGSEIAADVQETWTYGEDGKPLSFRSTGTVETADGAGEAVLVAVDFSYRADGTLQDKHYSHNSLLFGSTYNGTELVYDPSERLVSANSYITHGELRYYYFYEEDGQKPAYSLCLDDQGSGVMAAMYRW